MPIKATKEKKEIKKKFQAPAYTIDGTLRSQVDLDISVFGKDDNKRLLAQYVYIYLQNQRQGTASTLTRSEINATTKKVYRQKGTGGARHGSKRAPIYVGGGVSGGPKPRDYSKSFNKQQKRLSLLVALSNSALAQKISILEGDHTKMKPSTKIVASFLATIKKESLSTLLVMKQVEPNGLVLSIRNYPEVKIVAAHTLNAYDVMSYKHILFAHDGLETVINTFKPKS